MDFVNFSSEKNTTLANVLTGEVNQTVFCTPQYSQKKIVTSYYFDALTLTRTKKSDSRRNS